MRDLWAIGTAHRRTPDPTPEVDPWEDIDLIDGAHDDAVVVFRGLPSIEVHLFADGEDTVTVEQCVDFDIPRSETLALVDALQIGLRGGRLQFVRDWLQPFYGLQLVVPVAGREPYRQRVPYQPLQLWLSTLSVVP